MVAEEKDWAALVLRRSDEYMRRRTCRRQGIRDAIGCLHLIYRCTEAAEQLGAYGLLIIGRKVSVKKLGLNADRPLLNRFTSPEPKLYVAIDFLPFLTMIPAGIGSMAADLILRSSCPIGYHPHRFSFGVFSTKYVKYKHQ